jgi:TRAP-type C4-dicarboxylate transport system permease small subunit
MTEERHTQVTSEEIAQTFDEEVAPVSLAGYAPEDWLTLAAFWLMVLSVIAQFVTRYVLNDSLAWTEEIAVYALIVVVFMGSVMCVRRSRHIHVDFIYRYLPKGAARALSTTIDVLRIAFFAYATWLVWKYAALIPDEMMTTVNLPKSWVFNSVVLAFALMTLRAVLAAATNWRRGFSALDDPAAFEEAEAN